MKAINELLGRISQTTKSIIFIILIAVFGFIIIPLKASLHIDTSYDGKFKNHPGYEKILADLPYVYQESLAKIKNAFGIEIPKNMNVVVIFSDHLTHNGIRLRGKRRSVNGSNGKPIHYIHLDLEFLLNGQATLLEEMTHEMTHAVMAEIMGLRNYDALPMWIKEGTAVHAADQGLARIKALLRRGYNLAMLGNEDEGDDGNPISLEKYVENYLRIHFLLTTYGIEALQEFIRRLLKSGNVDLELARCFNGLTEETLSRYARDYIARVLIANSRPLTASEQLANGIRFFERGEYLSARLALTEAIDAGLSHKEYQRAAYLLAECYIQERNPELAFTVLQRVRPDPNDIPIDRYTFLQAYTQYAMGLISSSYVGFKQAFEISSSQAVKEGALYYIIRILLEMGNREEAGQVLEHLRNAYPKSSYIPLASEAFLKMR